MSAVLLTGEAVFAGHEEQLLLAASAKVLARHSVQTPLAPEDPAMHWQLDAADDRGGEVARAPHDTWLVPPAQ